MTIAVDLGRKPTKQTNKQEIQNEVWISLKIVKCHPYQVAYLHEIEKIHDQWYQTNNSTIYSCCRPSSPYTDTITVDIGLKTLLQQGTSVRAFMRICIINRRIRKPTFTRGFVCDVCLWLSQLWLTTVNSEIFARVLFSLNFAYAKFLENKTLVKWQDDSDVD